METSLWSRGFRIGAMLAVIGWGGFVFPQEIVSTADDRRHLALTLYSDGFGLVREVRRLSLPRGIARVRVQDVAATLEPATVSVRVRDGAGSFSLLEQEYESDVLRPERLLELSVGKELVIVRRLLVNGSEQLIPVRATLLAYQEGQAVWKIGEEIVIQPSLAEIRFPSVPEGVRAHPALIWTVKDEAGSDRELELSYMASGLSWEAHYVVILSEDGRRADLTGWATLTNRSGVAFRQADVRLLAGEVQRLKAARPLEREFALQAMARAATPDVQEREISEYHLYTFARPVTLDPHETKQLALASARGVRVSREYLVIGQPHTYRQPVEPGQPMRESVRVTFRFANAASEGLGIPLPAGVVRVYMSDPHAGLQFLGEDRIPHTPRDESVRVSIGRAFDLLAERRQTAFERIGRDAYEVEHELVLRNRKDEDVTITVLEPIGGDWEILRSNVPWQRAGAFAVRFEIPVARGAEARLIYRVRVRS